MERVGEWQLHIAKYQSASSLLNFDYHDLTLNSGCHAWAVQILKALSGL